MVYLATDASGMYKIGTSRDPARRIREMRTGNPTVELIAYGTGTSTEEKFLHEMYAKQNIEGEWFSLSDEDMLQLASDIEEGITLDWMEVWE